MMDQAQQTVFLLKNIPRDEASMMNDFLECALDVQVTHFEYSVTSGTTALVMINDTYDLEDIGFHLTAEQDLLDDRQGSLEVLDAGCSDDTVVVDNLDEEILSLEFLQLYFESTFADGYDVVSECKLLPNHKKTAVVTFSRKDVIPHILEMKDQVPLQSLGNYCIQVKPFYHMFYCATEDIPDQEISDCESVNVPDTHRDEIVNDREGDKLEDENTPEEQEDICFENDHEGDQWDDGEEEEEEDNCFENDHEGDQWDDGEEEEEEETMTVPNLKWRLLRDKFQDLPDCKSCYDEDTQCLKITGKDVGRTKTSIIELLQTVKRKSIELSEVQENILKSEKVKKMVEVFCNEEAERMTYEIHESSLVVYGIGDIESRVELMKASFLHTCSIPIPSDIPRQKIRDCERECKSLDWASVSFDSDKSQFIMTGLPEHVTDAHDVITKMLEEYDWKEDIFKLESKDAAYVKAYAMDQLKMLLKNENVIIISEDIHNEYIKFSFKSRKCYRRKIKQDLTTFQENIVKTNVTLKEFEAEELELITIHLNRDVHVLNDFKMLNACCIFVENDDNNEKMQPENPDIEPSVDPENKDPNEALYSSKQNKVIALGTSCQIHILPEGNIIKEKSDLLVCGLHESKNMKKTRVSTAFLNADGSLQDRMTTFDFSQNGVFVDETPLPGTSQSVAYIVLETWQQGVSDQKLISAVTELLNSANKKGCTSVSIPPLGSGQALKYPSDVVAQAIASAIDSFVRTNPGNSNTVKVINILAADRHLFTETIKAIDNVARAICDHSDKGKKKNSSVLKSCLKFVKSMVVKKDDHGSGSNTQKPVNVKLPIITIVYTRKEGTMKSDLTSKLKNEMKKHWLYVDYYKPGDTFCWPPQFMKDVTELEKKLNVRTKKVKDTTTQEFVYKIKGKLEDVQTMKDKLLQKIMKINEEMRLLFSQYAPGRGTLDFIKYATKCENQFPTFWTLKTKDFEQSSAHAISKLHKVDSNVFKAIESLVLKTWDANRVGLGHDAANIPSKSQVKVKNIQRLENPALFSRYFGKRLTILRDMQIRGRICQDVGQLKNSKGPVQITQHLDDAMKKELIREINEQYFFHGTKEDIVKSICEQGLDSRLSSSGGLFGQGVYTAESSTKADQYSDDRANRLPNGSDLTMFLTRVTLGDVFLCDDKHESVQSRDGEKLKRPPCLTCLKDRCDKDCRGIGQSYHSVMGDGKWIFREFVVYSSEQCYPEYLITYQRV